MQGWLEISYNKIVGQNILLECYLFSVLSVFAVISKLTA
jgi:hypothetical protein